MIHRHLRASEGSRGAFPPGTPGRTLRRGASALALPLCALAFACAAQEEEADAQTLSSRLRAGYAIEPPYAFLEPDGRVTGEAPELLRVAARAIRLAEVDWVLLEFAELIPALLDGRIDVIAAGMFITPERARRVRFSRPTTCVGSALVVRVDGGSPAEPAFAGDGRALAVIAGSVEELRLRERDAGELLVVPDAHTGVQAVRSGEAKGFVISEPTGRFLVAREDPSRTHLRVLEDHPALSALPVGCPAFAFRPDDAALAARVDSVLAGFVGSRAHYRLVGPLGFDSIGLQRALRSPNGEAGGR